jgi:hypothetical protein
MAKSPLWPAMIKNITQGQGGFRITSSDMIDSDKFDYSMSNMVMARVAQNI